MRGPSDALLLQVVTQGNQKHIYQTSFRPVIERSIHVVWNLDDDGALGLVHSSLRI